MVLENDEIDLLLFVMSVPTFLLRYEFPGLAVIYSDEVKRVDSFFASTLLLSFRLIEKKV